MKNKQVIAMRNEEVCKLIKCIVVKYEKEKSLKSDRFSLNFDFLLW